MKLRTNVLAFVAIAAVASLGGMSPSVAATHVPAGNTVNSVTSPNEAKALIAGTSQEGVNNGQVAEGYGTADNVVANTEGNDALYYGIVSKTATIANNLKVIDLSNPTASTLIATNSPAGRLALNTDANQPSRINLLN